MEIQILWLKNEAWGLVDDYLADVYLCLSKCQRVKAPELVHEDSEPMRFGSAGNSLITNAMKWFGQIKIRIYDRLEDPRIGPVLFLASLLSFGTIWLRRSQPTPPSRPPTQPSPSNQPTQPSTKVNVSFGFFNIISTHKMVKWFVFYNLNDGCFDCAFIWIFNMTMFLRYASFQEASKPRKRNRNRARTASNADIPPSITDFEPPNAYQMQLPDSDSE